MKKEYQKLRKLMLLYIIWLVLFFGGKALLSLFSIEYRLWLSVIGNIISAVTPCILLGQGIDLYNQKEDRKLPLTLYGILACMILCIAGAYGLCVMHEEYITEDGTLEVAYGLMLSESYLYPYERISVWGRKPAYGLEEMKQLEEKYGFKFEIDKTSSHLELHQIRYVTDTYPNLSVKAYFDEELIDDFCERYIGSIFARLYKELGIESDRGYQTFENGIYQVCLVSDGSDRKQLAKDAAMLISYTMLEIENDTNAPCTSGILYLVVRTDGQAWNIPLSFGDSCILKENNWERDYFASTEHVCEELSVWIND